MTQTDAEFMKEMDYFDTYGAGCGFETRWSIYDENIKMGNKHPFKTPMTIQNKCEVWGYDASVVCTGETWGISGKLVMLSYEIRLIVMETKIIISLLKIWKRKVTAFGIW